MDRPALCRPPSLYETVGWVSESPEGRKLALFPIGQDTFFFNTYYGLHFPRTISSSCWKPEGEKRGGSEKMHFLLCFFFGNKYGERWRFFSRRSYTYCRIKHWTTDVVFSVCPCVTLLIGRWWSTHALVNLLQTSLVVQPPVPRSWTTLYRSTHQ